MPTYRPIVVGNKRLSTLSRRPSGVDVLIVPTS
jgi:hypothetical protein